MQEQQSGRSGARASGDFGGSSARSESQAPLLVTPPKNHARRAWVAAAVVALAVAPIAITAVYQRSDDYVATGLPSPSLTSEAPSIGSEIPAGVLPQPGEVGFLGDASMLRVIDGPENAPEGTQFSTGVLVTVDANLTLDGVHLKGSIDYGHAGTLTIRNSIIEAVGGFHTVINVSNPRGIIDISDSTVTWPESVPTPQPPWGSGAINGDARMIVVRCDISGTPDGIQQGSGNSRFEENYIHDLAILGEPPNNTHNDGMQFYLGPNIQVLYNYIELDGYNGVNQNAAVFFGEGDGIAAPVIVGNYLSGGGYQLRLEAGVTDATVIGNQFGPIAGGFSEASISPGATVVVWAGNVTASGANLTQPEPG